jgi:hypothetical protein
VVASAGNGASDVPFWPAAAGSRGVVGQGGAPLVSVGSTNAGRRKVSHFSNTGGWVRTYRPGAGVVSTMPVTLDGAAQASQLGTGSAHPQRGTPDLDDFSSGFGLWSGTSFSAPGLVGELASALAGKPRAKDLQDRIALACQAADQLCAAGVP